MLRTLSIGELQVGMDVVFIDDSLNVHPTAFVDTPYHTHADHMRGRLARIVKIQDVPGKKVGIAFKEPIDSGLPLDGLLPAKYEKHGAWVLPDHLYTPEMYDEHKAAAAGVGIDREEVEKALEGFLP
jgi:hypothetical protein